MHHRVLGIAGVPLPWGQVHRHEGLRIIGLVGYIIRTGSKGAGPPQGIGLPVVTRFLEGSSILVLDRVRYPRYPVVIITETTGEGGHKDYRQDEPGAVTHGQIKGTQPKKDTLNWNYHAITG